jgi:hypothetical protein
VVEPGERHQHQADRAIAADEVPGAAVECPVDDRAVDRVENDGGLRGHAERARGVNPVAAPARRPEARVDVAGVVAALTGDDHVVGGQGRQIEGVREGRRVDADARRCLTDLGGGEELDLADAGEIPLGLHPVQNTEPTMPRHPTNPTRIWFDLGRAI